MRAIFRKGIPLDADGDGLTLYPGGDISLTNAILTFFFSLSGRRLCRTMRVRMFTAAFWKRSTA